MPGEAPQRHEGNGADGYASENFAARSSESEGWRVYVIDVNDELLTFNAENGTPDWTYQALTEPARIMAASSPAVSNGTLVASFASGELVALRSDNGTELWNLPLSHTMSGRLFAVIPAAGHSR